MTIIYLFILFSVLSIFDILLFVKMLLLQVDLQLPARFELYYIAEGEEGKKEMPVIIGTTVLGSAERMFALLLEHYKGNWPFWLSPCQAIVCPDTNISMPYALQVINLITVVSMFFFFL